MLHSLEQATKKEKIFRYTSSNFSSLILVLKFFSSTALSIFSFFSISLLNKHQKGNMFMLHSLAWEYINHCVWCKNSLMHTLSLMANKATPDIGKKNMNFEDRHWLVKALLEKRTCRAALNYPGLQLWQKPGFWIVRQGHHGQIWGTSAHELVHPQPQPISSTSNFIKNTGKPRPTPAVNVLCHILPHKTELGGVEKVTTEGVVHIIRSWWKQLRKQF